MTSINFKVIGLMQPGFKATGSGLETTVFRSLDLPEWEAALYSFCHSDWYIQRTIDSGPSCKLYSGSPLGDQCDPHHEAISNSVIHVIPKDITKEEHRLVTVCMHGDYNAVSLQNQTTSTMSHMSRSIPLSRYYTNSPRPIWLIPNTRLLSNNYKFCQLLGRDSNSWPAI